MEEDNAKGLIDRVKEMESKLGIYEKKEKKTNFFSNIPGVGWIIGLILGGLGFILGWTLAKDISIGLLVGIPVFVVTVVVSSMWNMFPPFSARRLGKRKKRQNYVVFMNIGTNRAVTFIKAKIDDGVALVNGVPHVVSPDDILIWKNKIPIVIQPQFSEKPYSVKHHYERVEEDNERTEGWQLIMNYIYKTQITEKKKISTGLIIIGVIAVIGLGYYLIKSGALS